MIAFATSSSFPTLTEDDRAVVEPLAHCGFQVQPAVWNHPGYRWQAYEGVIIRSCWDYHLKLSQYLEWIAFLEEKRVRVWNVPSILRWNSTKTYLRELERKGIPIIPTLWPEDSGSLFNMLCEVGWTHAVIKPRVSATAHRTCVTSIDNIAEGQALLDELLSGPGAMVQKFIPAIVSQGEWSLIFFAGSFSHAVLKTPKDGDFRVQHDFGGSERPAVPPPSVIEAASRAIAEVVPQPLYARADGVESDSHFLLMELELIEPALFLSSHSAAATSFAKAIASAISGQDRSVQ